MGGVVYCSGRTRPWATARSKMQERKRIRAVRGYEGSTLTLDDLWRVFSCYGEVASVIIEPGHGATVTYREPGAELELVCGEQRVLVSRHQVWPLEGAEWPQQRTTTIFRPAHYCPPSPPLSPHYDAAILDVGKPSPAPLYSLSVPLHPAAAMAMGKVDGVVICGGGLQGEV